MELRNALVHRVGQCERQAHQGGTKVDFAPRWPTMSKGSFHGGNDSVPPWFYERRSHVY
jgi:hypothetical protein